MSKLFEGQGLQAKCVKFELIANPKKGNRPEVWATFEIVDDKSPHKGAQVKYSGNFTTSQVKYTRLDLLALGWQGKNIDTADDDIMKAPKVVPIDVEIASHTYPDTNKRIEWSTVRSIGRSAAPTVPLDQAGMMDVQQWLTEAAKEEETPFG